MQKDTSGLYSAFLAKDARFDGRFFVGVSSTGIYCRPVCRARMPKKENCTFFSSAAEAEQAGYRPCLLCRPELAPGMSAVDASTSLARRAARMREENCGQGKSWNAMPPGSSVRDVICAAYLKRNFTYRQYSTCRHAGCCWQNAFGGYDIVRRGRRHGIRFRESAPIQRCLQKKIPPRSQRYSQKNEGRKQKNAAITIALGYRPPYLWENLLRFLEARAIAGVEMVRGSIYYRTVCLPDAGQNPATGWIAVSNSEERHALEVSLSESLLPVLPQVLGKIRNMFDLYCDPEAVFASLAVMNDIRENLCRKGTRLPGCFDPFEMSVRAILGQQITVKAASTLAERLAVRFGSPVETPIEGLTRLFPSPERLAGLEGRRNGISVLWASSGSGHPP